MTPRFSLLLTLAVLAIALPIHAQTGCTDSPESPTLVLAVVSGVGALVAGVRRSRIGKSK
jgi:XrtJ-associated TM-motif-TM protein